MRAGEMRAGEMRGGDAGGDVRAGNVRAGNRAGEMRAGDMRAGDMSGCMKKVVIVVLVVVAVLMVVFLVLRPGGSSTSTEPPGWAKLLDDLAPKTTVERGDVAGRPCWDDQGVLILAPGNSCDTRLPEKANRIALCIEQPFAKVAIQGSEYGPQDVQKQTGIGCPTGQEFTLYDDSSTLFASCAPLGNPCVLRLT